MRGGSQRNDKVMVVGKLLFETAKFSIQRAKESYDLLYAVGSGTAIGIASGETIRGSYELWRGSSRSNAKSRAEKWYNRSLRRRFKGDVLVETDNKVQETYDPDQPIHRKPSGFGKYGHSVRVGSNKFDTKRRRRRCDCKSVLRRILGKPRQRKRRW